MRSAPLVPAADEKDWTWAMREPCPECGFEPAAVRREDVPALTLRYAAALADALATERATTRPAPAVWSPLEYACHVRDVCDRFRGRLELMRAQDDPLFENWDQDATALQERYWAQQPAAVRAQLEDAAGAIAAAFAAVRPQEWERPGRRSNGSVFTIDSLARYFLHDLAHHAADVRRR